MVEDQLLLKGKANSLVDVYELLQASWYSSLDYTAKKAGTYQMQHMPFSAII